MLQMVVFRYATVAGAHNLIPSPSCELINLITCMAIPALRQNMKPTYFTEGYGLDCHIFYYIGLSAIPSTANWAKV